MGIPDDIQRPPTKKLFFNEDTCYHTNGNFVVNLLATHDVY